MSLLTLWDSLGLLLWALWHAAGQREPCGERGVGRRWREAGWNTGVASREGELACLLAGEGGNREVKRSRIRTWVGFLERGEGWREMSQVLPAEQGSSDASWSILVDKVRMQGDEGAWGRSDPRKVDGMYVYFAILMGRKEQRSCMVRCIYEGKGNVSVLFFFLLQMSSFQESSEILQSIKKWDFSCFSLLNLGMRQTLGSHRRLAAFILTSRPLKRNQPPCGRYGKRGPRHP